MKNILLATGLSLACMINTSQAYNVYLYPQGNLAPAVEVKIFYEAVAGNKNQIASYKSAAPGKIGSWNWGDMRTNLGLKFKSNDEVVARVKVNFTDIPIDFPLPVSGYLLIEPISDTQVKVSTHKGDQSVVFESTYNYKSENKF